MRRELILPPVLWRSLFVDGSHEYQDVLQDIDGYDEVPNTAPFKIRSKLGLMIGIDCAERSRQLRLSGKLATIEGMLFLGEAWMLYASSAGFGSLFASLKSKLC